MNFKRYRNLGYDEDPMNKKWFKRKLPQIYKMLGYGVLRYETIFRFDLSIANWLKKEGIDLVLDVGANTGQYAMKLREFGYQGHIISFEPLSEAYASLAKNSSIDPKWSVAPRAAIGAKNGREQIFISENFVSSSLLEMMPIHTQCASDSKYVGSEDVDVRTLDSFMGDVIPTNTKFVLKIDAQGYEDRVLNGVKENLSNVRALQLELSTVCLYENQPLLPEMIGHLSEKGFVIFSIRPGFRNPETSQLFQIDFFLVREKEVL